MAPAAAIHASLRAAKKELRKHIKETLKTVSAESQAHQSSIAAKALFALPEYQSARNVAVYLAMPSGEIQTSEIVHDAFRQGKQVYVPSLHKLEQPNVRGRKSIMEMLALDSISDYESLKADKWGIPSVDPESVARRRNCLGGHGLLTEREAQADVSENREQDEPLIGLDLIVVPGMAFDRSLRRLGHGAGYYDDFLTKYLSTMREHNEKKGGPPAKRPYLAALALKEQILPEDEGIPVEEHDYLVDAVFVGDGSIIDSAISPN
ncbi:hypothetical protein KEM56_007007 [Ascosphaera pollenicola]|nr:hypothetical protein KEM56_007007 [Ascosphaera pollenicola]